jgi:hypothetical protein
MIVEPGPRLVALAASRTCFMLSATNRVLAGPCNARFVALDVG